MRKGQIIYIIFIINTLALASCKEETPVQSPVIHATVSPATGNTTQIFNFNLNQSESRTGRGTKVFSRWDWDGDGIWDTPFTRMLVYEHRYYKPGTWKPRLEMSNLEGTTDTLSFTIPVTRGYSPPKPVLLTKPGKGHIYTRFLLDASGTSDDEDSLNQLSFRWDFEGDGQWDTGFGDSIKIFHQFPQIGLYLPTVQVRDKSGLSSNNKSQVLVTMEDQNLIVNFRCIPDSITNDTPIIMDASGCSDPEYPDQPLLYRWDWNNDQVWDTGWLTDPIIEHIFIEEFFHFVRLGVKSSQGLTKEVAVRLRVYHKNTPPIAHYSMSTVTGNMGTEFRIDCWWSRDQESAPSQLTYQLDFESDGQFDTPASSVPFFSVKYPAPGIYNTTVKATDPIGASDTFSRIVTISQGTNQTGMYLDTRGATYEYYGTVLIGDQWWFTRSLSVRDQDPSFYCKYCAVIFNGDETGAYRDYGCRYSYGTLPILCPDGWRVPSREDWNKLFSNYSEDELYEALRPGGKSDFGANLYAKTKEVDPADPEPPEFSNVGYYWSTTTPMESTSVSAWVITFDNKQKKVLRGYDERERTSYLIRCVKDK